MPLLHTARQTFYRAGGPWYRNRVFERFGSQRYARPALHGMDGRLLELLPDGPGVFVEAGAHDGFTQSNTYFLERHCGWSGLLVEAVPALHAKARRRRPRSQVVHAALVGPEHEDDMVTIRFNDLMSTLGAGEADAAKTSAIDGGRRYEIAVPARTLSSLLDDAGIAHVDLLSLDVEGYEEQVLRGIDFDRHAPTWLLLEMLEMERQRPTFDALLAERYEFAESLSAWDALYRRRD